MARFKWLKCLHRPEWREALGHAPEPEAGRIRSAALSANRSWQAMKPVRMAYNLAAFAAAGLLPGVWLGSKLARRWDYFWPRVGLYRDLAPARKGPRVWLQAVSVGEVAVAKAISEKLLHEAPAIQIYLTTSTDKGLAEAKSTLGHKAAIAPFPLDLPWPVRAACSRIRPQVYASVETEIWPNLLSRLDAMGTDILLLNGRISPRSFPRYRKLKWLVEPSLLQFKRLSMIGAEDAKRIIALGARPENVTVDGNAKYAGLMGKVDQARAMALGESLGLGNRPLLVAGSGRSGEEAPVLTAFKQLLDMYPQTVLAVAPRHVEKGPRWLKQAAKLGLSARALSALGREGRLPADIPLLVVDAMGLLFDLYGLAKQQGGAAFVGASLVKLGGQNPMEPAAWGLPVCFGPSMEDFADAACELELAGAARRVDDADALAGFWLKALAGESGGMGRAAESVLRKSAAAAENAAGLILERLSAKGLLESC